MEQQKKGFLDRPVRLRVLLWITGVLVFAGLVFYGLQVWQMAKLRAETVDEIQLQVKLKGVALAETIAITSREDVLKSRYSTLQDYLSEIVRQPDVRYLIVMTPDARAVVHTDAKYRGKKLDDSVSKRALDAQETDIQDLKDSTMYDIAVPVMSFTRKAAVVRVGVSYQR